MTAISPLLTESLRGVQFIHGKYCIFIQKRPDFTPKWIEEDFAKSGRLHVKRLRDKYSDKLRETCVVKIQKQKQGELVEKAPESDQDGRRGCSVGRPTSGRSTGGRGTSLNQVQLNYHKGQNT